MLSHFNNKEEESFDIQGAYLFGERDFDRSRTTFGLIVNPLGAGVFQNFARNNLNISTQNATHKGSLSKDRHFFQWGHSLERQSISNPHSLKLAQSNDSPHSLIKRRVYFRRPFP